jgi:hypothetical protein
MTTTKISELPTENISLEKKEVVQQNIVAPENSKEINNLVKELEDNKVVTGLPSRDIPKNLNVITNDKEISPNYVPEQTGEDYIKQYEDFIKSTNIQSQKQKEEKTNEIFDIIKVPVLAACLFFLFQMPVIRKTLFNKVPMLFTNDGNPKVYYFILNTLIFGITMYGVQQIFE